ncbi:MAG TPA: FAD-dependent oxidoreductase [Polaromonas sp.]|uniref:FAD-dependent oxidoreductase n=1 Tax=Polaromonas sp. TaxID=1869339 RepID=UPI002D427478|nr:FAD-dependent oxidoreductase [Polaromonas sp.]HYW56381.1 FAD-dependent oxidoreductase [Polaromonas sp.]
MHIGIAGAGLLGRLLAFELTRAGHTVEVFDPAPGPLPPVDSRTPYAAGWTAAGMLSPTAELESADANVFELGLRSLALWPGIVAALGLPVELQQRGSLLLAHRGDEGAAKRVVDLLLHKAPAGHAPTALTMAELAGLEPDMHGAAHAWLLPHEGHIHTVPAMTALADTATAKGAVWHWGVAVQRLAAGEIHIAGKVHHFDCVFDVRGTGARTAGDSGECLGRDVRGVRGEIIWLHAPGVALQRPVRLLHPRHRVYLVPREGDHIVVGASEIESEDRSPISLRSMVELLAAAHSIMPGLAEARIVHTETNLRPALPDNLPRLVQEPGLVQINGLFRHGWLIAPALVEQAMENLAPHSACHPDLIGDPCHMNQRRGPPAWIAGQAGNDI